MTQATLSRQEQVERDHALAIRQVSHAKRCYHDFDYFVQSFWYVVEPDKALIWGWWLDAICQAVQRQQEGDHAYRWLLVMQPPGTAKSRIMSVLKPAWVWLRWPSRRMLYISTAQDVAARDSRYTRDILKSSGWDTPSDDDPDLLRCGYRDVVAILHELGRKSPKGTPLYQYPLWDFAKDQDEKGNFANSRTGVRLCKPMGASITGERGDDVTIDDPVDFEELRSAPPATIALNMASADTKARYVYTTRVNDRETSTRTLVMQRLDPDDPAGTALRDNTWRVICVPMEFDPDHPHRMPEDPRTIPGEPLIGYTIEPGPARRRIPRPLQTEALKVQAIRDLGPTQYDAQYNQKPRRATGEFVTAADIALLERTHDDPQTIAREADEVMITADFTFDDTANSDRVALHAWARTGAARFTLIGRDTRRMNYPEMKRALKALKQRFPQARRILIEKAAAGPMIRADLESEIPGMILVPTGSKSKWERAKVALQPLIKGRNIVLLAPEQAPWVAEVEASWLHMRPGGKDDDDVDAAAIMGAQWGVGGTVTPQWLPASTALSQAPLSHPIEDNVRPQPPDSDRRYLVTSGPNPIGGTPTAWSVFDLKSHEEVACWTGTVDPLAQAQTLAAVGRHFNNATLAVSSQSPAVIAALLRAGYPKVWQDSSDPAKHPGWYRVTVDLDRAVSTLARSLVEARIRPQSPEGRNQLLGWDGDPSAPPTQSTARVWPYLISADVMERLGAYRKTPLTNPIRDPVTGGVRLSVYFGERTRRAVI